MTPILTMTLTVLGVLAHLVVIFVLLLLEQRRPASTLAWLLAVIFLPFIGLGLFLLIGTRRMMRRTRKKTRVTERLDTVFQRFRIDAKLQVEGESSLQDLRTRTLLRLSSKLCETPMTHGNAVRILVNAKATYNALFMAFKAARHHIHVQFYIIKADRWGEQLRDRLAERAREGIEVRLMCDAVGSYGIPSGFWDSLLEAGGEVGVYKPVNPLIRFRRRDRVDFRNHRKIVVVDGRIAFTGGINIGKEYLGLNPDLGHWRDTYVQLEGPAALALQMTFAEDWLLASGTTLDKESYYPDPGQREDLAGGCTVQIIDSGPDQRWSPIHLYYFQAIALAQERVWITSPYFVPDEAMEKALISAALRGVDVRLLVPSRSDVQLITLASRSYYNVLQAAGVRIYEYARGFVHAKTLVVDNWVGTIGSANLDVRSFYLNFEINAFVFAQHFTKQLAEQFESDLHDARELPENYRAGLSILQRLGQAFARLLSPLL